MGFYKDLHQMDIADAINSFVQFFKNTEQTKDKVLAVSLNLSASYYSENNKDVHGGKEITLLFQSPNNYTIVAWTEKSVFDLENKEVELEFEAYHDSCWRDGTSRVIGQAAKEIEKAFNEDIQEKASTFNHFGMGDVKILDSTINAKGGYETGACKLIPNKKDE